MQGTSLPGWVTALIPISAWGVCSPCHPSTLQCKHSLEVTSSDCLEAVCCDPRSKQSLSPHGLTPPLAVSAEDLILVCKLNHIKNFSPSERQILPSAPLLSHCRVDHHLGQDSDAPFKLKHKQQCCSSSSCPKQCWPCSSNLFPFMEKAGSS